MACYHPVSAWFSAYSTKRQLTFKKPTGSSGTPDINVPCNKCIGCQLEKANTWATRISQEAKTNAENCFITLTYNDDHQLNSGNLCRRDLQLFIKRLRKYISPKKIRYYACGEYGERTARPHFHICLFGHSFTDQKLYKKTLRGDDLYTSETLDKLWTSPETKQILGFSTIGILNYATAAYTARYVTKKQLTPSHHFSNLDIETGELTERVPEFATMSLKPGIGYDYFQKHGAEATYHDFLIVNGSKKRLPKYYDLLIKRKDEALFETLKTARIIRAREKLSDNTRARLKVKEICLRARIKSLKRGLDT